MEHCTKRPSDGAKPVLDIGNPASARMSVDEFFRSILRLSGRADSLSEPVDFSSFQHTHLGPVVDTANKELTALEERAKSVSLAFERLLNEKITAPAGEEYTAQMRAEASKLRLKHTELGQVMALRQKMRFTEQLITAVYDANCSYINARASSRALDLAGEKCWQTFNEKRNQLTELTAEAESAVAAAQSNTSHLDSLYSELSQLEQALITAPSSESLLHAALDPVKPRESCLDQLKSVCEQYGATVSYDLDHGYINLDFLDISVDLNTGGLNYNPNLPNEGFEPLEYILKQLQGGTGQYTARKAMAAWKWGLELNDALVSLSSAGEREITEENSQFTIRQTLRQFNTVLSVRLQGLKLAVSGCTPDVVDPRVDRLLRCPSNPFLPNT